MKQITFDTSTLGNQEASSKYVSLFYFQGKNHTDKVINIKSGKASCGCTTISYNKEIQPQELFTITLTINKINQSGYFSHSATIEFDNGQTQVLQVNGIIK